MCFSSYYRNKVNDSNMVLDLVVWKPIAEAAKRQFKGWIPFYKGGQRRISGDGHEPEKDRYYSENEWRLTPLSYPSRLKLQAILTAVHSSKWEGNKEERWGEVSIRIEPLDLGTVPPETKKALEEIVSLRGNKDHGREYLKMLLRLNEMGMASAATIFDHLGIDCEEAEKEYELSDDEEVKKVEKRALQLLRDGMVENEEGYEEIARDALWVACEEVRPSNTMIGGKIIANGSLVVKPEGMNMEYPIIRCTVCGKSDCVHLHGSLARTEPPKLEEDVDRRIHLLMRLKEMDLISTTTLSDLYGLDIEKEIEELRAAGVKVPFQALKTDPWPTVLRENLYDELSRADLEKALKDEKVADVLRQLDEIANDPNMTIVSSHVDFQEAMDKALDERTLADNIAAKKEPADAKFRPFRSLAELGIKASFIPILDKRPITEMMDDGTLLEPVWDYGPGIRIDDIKNRRFHIVERASPKVEELPGAYVLRYAENSNNSWRWNMGEFVQELYNDKLINIPVRPEEYLLIMNGTVEVEGLPPGAKPSAPNRIPLTKFRLLGQYHFESRSELNEWLAAKAKGNVPERLEKRRIP